MRGITNISLFSSRESKNLAISCDSDNNDNYNNTTNKNKKKNKINKKNSNSKSINDDNINDNKNNNEEQKQSCELCAHSPYLSRQSQHRQQREIHHRCCSCADVINVLDPNRLHFNLLTEDGERSSAISSSGEQQGFEGSV